MMAKSFRSYYLMLKWVSLSYRTWLSLNFAVQIGIAVAFIYGISFFYPQITPAIAKYLTTGAPTIILLTVGLVMAPQIMAGARLEGTFDYIWSLPIPRMVYIAAEASVLFATTLPGIALAVVLGAFHFDFDLSISPLLVPAVILIAGCGTFIGYSIAFSVPKPMMVNVITQIIVFLVMMFSPVMFPVEQLPGWLQAVHQVLPIKYMAFLMRGTLTDLSVNLGQSFAIVGGWFVAGFITTTLLVNRRQ
jgi:ABC-2 type transport system permease protein